MATLLSHRGEDAHRHRHWRYRKRERSLDVSIADLDDGTTRVAVNPALGLSDPFDPYWVDRLPHYRSLVSKAWGRKTAHKRFKRQARRGGPAGQCGVTSAWLIVVLAEVHGVPATYCYGDVLAVGDPRASLRDHCWLEVGGLGDEKIVDLTCNQSQTFRGAPVLCASSNLIYDRYSVVHKATARLTIDELDHDEVQHRLPILVRAVGVDHLRVVPDRWAKLF